VLLVMLRVSRSEAVVRAGPVKGCDARTSRGQRPPALEVALCDQLEGPAGSEADDRAQLLVPPAIGGNVRAVAVEDPRLRERCRGRHSAAVRLRLVALLRQQLGDEGHRAGGDGPLQERVADAVEVEDDQAPTTHPRPTRPAAQPDVDPPSRPGSTMVAGSSTLSRVASSSPFSRASSRIVLPDLPASLAILAASS